MIAAITPTVLWYSLIKNIPGVWLRPSGSRTARIATTIGVLIAMPLITTLIYTANGYAIGWIADRDPCAAFAAGVTGSKPPEDCP